MFPYYKHLSSRLQIRNLSCGRNKTLLRLSYTSSSASYAKKLQLLLEKEEDGEEEEVERLVYNKFDTLQEDQDEATWSGKLNGDHAEAARHWQSFLFFLFSTPFALLSASSTTTTASARPLASSFSLFNIYSTYNIRPKLCLFRIILSKDAYTQKRRKIRERNRFTDMSSSWAVSWYLRRAPPPIHPH